MKPERIAEQHREHVEMFLSHRGDSPPARPDAELLAALCSTRGALSLLGRSEEGDTEALALLGEDNLSAVVNGIDVPRLEARLESILQASSEAGGDVSLVEPEEDADALCEEARLLLWERHDIECRLAGIEWFLARRPDLEAVFRTPLADLGEALARFDARLRAGIRHFLPLNVYRRRYRDDMPDPARFWWWHELADCDLQAVYDAIDTEEVPEHVRGCAQCSALLEGLRQVRQRLARVGPVQANHPAVEDLVAYFHGELAGDQEEGIDWHLRVCGICREELEALLRADDYEGEEDGDEAEEETGEIAAYLVRSYQIPPEPPGVQVAVAADSADQHDVVRGLGAEFVGGDDEVKVWIGRRNDRMVLLVIAPDPSAIGEVEITDADSLESLDVGATTVASNTIQLDLGSIGELAGRRLLTSLFYQGRPVQLPRIDIETEGRK